MKSSNEAQIQHAFTQQAAGFESKRMNFSKQGLFVFCGTKDCSVKDRCRFGGSRRNLCLRSDDCPVCQKCCLSGYDTRYAIRWKSRGSEKPS